MGGGANVPALVEAQRNFATFGASAAELSGRVRPPLPHERKDAEWRPIGSTDSIHPSDADWNGDRPIYPKDYTELYYWRDTYWRKSK
jgi:hypothetical protein